MKKVAIAAVIAALPASAFAQSAISAYQLSQPDLRGTARFMSMGGAFGALGGDLSTLNQNPAGIGIYRSSEIGVTMDINMTSSDVDGTTWDKTNVYCNNFGYVGAVTTGSDIMPFFQWGATYSRVSSFDRQYKGGFGQLGTSLSNYIASFSQGYDPAKLGMSNNYDPYTQSGADWLSILAYNSYLINSVGMTDQYNGLWREGQTSGDAMFNVREKGHVDEYSINFGGNFLNTVYWGMGFGITDLSFTQETNYDEQLDRAQIASTEGMGSAVESGNAYYNLNNYRHVSGTGFNFKIGAIVKPINELRFGIAVHTPTYYNLSESSDAAVDYSYSSKVPAGTAYSDYNGFDWKLRTPWKLIASVAGVIDGRLIISADYELNDYKSMGVKDNNGDEYDDVKTDIKNMYKPVNIVRLGAEYRITPGFSVRAGFANASSGVKNEYNEGDQYVATSGTDPSYTFDTTTRYVTFGIGYRYKGFYVDAAYVNKYRKSSYHPFTSFEETYSDGKDWCYAPKADFTTSENNIVLSLGVKF